MSEPTPDEPEEEAGSGSERVRLFVSDRLVLVGRDATMRQMAQRMVAEGVGAQDHVHGIVSERDVVMAIAAGSDLDSTTAGDLDSRRLLTCTPETTVQAAAMLMMENYVRHLLVTDQTGPVGMVSDRDLLGAYVT
jgi:predicted transcriptional regulator